MADPYPANKSAAGWLNPAAFTRPAPGTYGNQGRNTLVGPASFQLDLAVTRTVRVGEGKTLQFRGEAFNLPNHVNLGNPISARNNTRFGLIQSAGDPRIMQLALKFVF